MAAANLDAPHLWATCPADAVAGLLGGDGVAARLVHLSVGADGCAHALLRGHAPVEGAGVRARPCAAAGELEVAAGRWGEVMQHAAAEMANRERFLVAAPGNGRLVLAAADQEGRAAVEAARTLARPVAESSLDLAALAARPEDGAARFWWSRRAPELLAAAEKAAAPVFAYSRGEVRARLDRLVALRNVGRVFFATKANWHPAVLQEVHDAGAGFECVSVHEIRHVLALFPNLERTRVLYTPNFASRADYELARRQGVLLTVDNSSVLERWPETFARARLMVRLDTGVGLGHHEKTRTGGPKSKFGVTADQLLGQLPLLERVGAKVVGLHVHAGSGITDADNWARNGAELARLLPSFKDLRFFNLGGGLGVPYHPDDPELDLDEVDRRLDALRPSLPEHLELWMEPGRYVAAQAGVMLARVTQLKSKSGKRFVGLEAGMNALMRPALYQSYHHIVNLSRLGRAGDHPTAAFDVVGPICESGDILGRARELPADTAEGDWFLVATCGAYGRCMSSNYNLLPFLDELVLE